MTSLNGDLHGTYSYPLVVISVLISVFAAYAALDLAGRVASARGFSRSLWLAGGAVAMGIGIWAMHYVGMLAFRLPIPVEYDWPTVLLSMLAAICASAIALYVASRQTMGASRAFLGSVFMGVAIAGMHYIGMAAMRLPAMCHYSPTVVVVSVVLAVLIAWAALSLTFRFKSETSAGGWRKLLSAAVMGCAVPVMHHTGMAAVSFTASSVEEQDLSHALSISALGTACIVAVTFLILSLSIVTAVLDRGFATKERALASSEKRSQQILQTCFDAFVGDRLHRQDYGLEPAIRKSFRMAARRGIG